MKDSSITEKLGMEIAVAVVIAVCLGLIAGGVISILNNAVARERDHR